MKIFRIASMPASEGDSLVITYGNEVSLKHILIDAGRHAAVKHIERHFRENDIKHLELLVVTHVDADHIEGMIDFLDNNPDIVIDDIWFNGYRHLADGADIMGAVQGEQLTERIKELKWNLATGGKSISILGGNPRKMTRLPGGMDITLLSPDAAKLLKMVPVWNEECANAGIVPTIAPILEEIPAGLESMGAIDIDMEADKHTEDDKKAANGSSIAFVAEYQGKRVLFGADAHPDIMLRSLQKLSAAKPFEIDLFKVCHHGSKANTTKAMLERLACSNYLISTSGSRFKHPDQPAIARIIKYGGDNPTIYFNYRQEQTDIWGARARLPGEPTYDCVYADDGEPLIIELLP